MLALDCIINFLSCNLKYKNSKRLLFIYFGQLDGSYHVDAIIFGVLSFYWNLFQTTNKIPGSSNRNSKWHSWSGTGTEITEHVFITRTLFIYYVRLLDHFWIELFDDLWLGYYRNRRLRKPGCWTKLRMNFKIMLRCFFEYLA